MASYREYDIKDKKLYEEVEKLKNGDTMAYDMVYKLSQKYIYKLIMDIVNDFSITESIMQDVYEQIYNRIATLRNPKTFYVWAGRIATDAVLVYIKNNKPELLEMDLGTCIDDGTFIFNRAYEDTEEFIPESIVADVNKLNFIAGVLDELSTGAKISIQYFYYQEMSVAEIMSKMGCTSEVVKARLINSKNLVKRAIAQAGMNPGERMYNLGTVPIFWLAFRNGYESLVFASPDGDDDEKTSMLYGGMGLGNATVVPGYGAMGGSGAMGGANISLQNNLEFSEQKTVAMSASMQRVLPELNQQPQVNQTYINEEPKTGSKKDTKKSKKGVVIGLSILLLVLIAVGVIFLIKLLGDKEEKKTVSNDVATILDATPMDEATMTDDVSEEEVTETIIETTSGITEEKPSNLQEATSTDASDTDATPTDADDKPLEGANVR